MDIFYCYLEAIEKFGSPIYVRHEVVHNKIVVEDLKSKGVIFVDELDEVPDGERVIFSAHGVAKSVEDEAEERNLNYFDATCPLVTKVHNEVIRHNRANRDVVLIGHAGHPEVEGTIGRHDPSSSRNIYLVEDVNDVKRLEVSDEMKIAYVTQTTLSLDDTKDIVDALNAKFPSLHQPRSSDICYATQNRQNAVKELASQVERILVVGASNSSNTLRLVEVARAEGTAARRVEEASEIERADVEGVNSIGITAGASAPEDVVQSIVTKLCRLAPQHSLRELRLVDENVNFALPALLRTA